MSEHRTKQLTREVNRRLYPDPDFSPSPSNRHYPLQPTGHNRVTDRADHRRPLKMTHRIPRYAVRLLVLGGVLAGIAELPAGSTHQDRATTVTQAEVPAEQLVGSVLAEDIESLRKGGDLTMYNDVMTTSSGRQSEPILVTHPLLLNIGNSLYWVSSGPISSGHNRKVDFAKIDVADIGKDISDGNIIFGEIDAKSTPAKNQRSVIHLNSNGNFVNNDSLQTVVVGQSAYQGSPVQTVAHSN